MTWFFVNSGQQAGPISDIQLDEYILAGKILPDTLIWREGMEIWQPCQEVKSALAYKAPTLRTPVKSTGDTVVAEIVCGACGGLQSREGAIKQGEAWICAACRPIHIQKVKAPTAAHASDKVVYAGVGVRAVAKLLDGLILAVPAIIVMSAVVAFALPASIKAKSGGAFLLTVIGSALLIGLTMVIYQIWCLPKFGATPGKRLMGLRVIRAGGAEVSWGRSAGRFAGECINTLIPFFIGYIIAAFDSERRTVHDHIAGTRVIKA
jgi:uncharacterized RDD family membrane protein YckC